MSSVFRKVVDDILGFDLPSNKKKPVAQALVAPGQPVIVPDKDSGDDFLPPGKPEDSVMEETAPETTAPTAPSISNNMNRDGKPIASVVKQSRRRPGMGGYGSSATRRIARNRLGLASRFGGKGRGIANDLLGG